MAVVPTLLGAMVVAADVLVVAQIGRLLWAAAGGDFFGSAAGRVGGARARACFLILSPKRSFALDRSTGAPKTILFATVRVRFSILCSA